MRDLVQARLATSLVCPSFGSQSDRRSPDLTLALCASEPGSENRSPCGINTKTSAGTIPVQAMWLAACIMSDDLPFMTSVSFRLFKYFHAMAKAKAGQCIIVAGRGVRILCSKTKAGLPCVQSSTFGNLFCYRGRRRRSTGTRKTRPKRKKDWSFFASYGVG